MASGKTTFGRALAQARGWEFLDLDEAVEREAGKSISRIMAEEGEEKFRLLESRLLKKTMSMKKTVIACGGGTPCYRDNMEFMTLHGQTLWLVASPERITDRILAAGDTRPLAAGKSREELREFVGRHLLERQRYYCKASMRFSGERLETDEEVKQSVGRFCGEMTPEGKKIEGFKTPFNKKY